MRNIPTKVEDGGTSADGQYFAAEFNSNQDERENAVTATNQVLDGATGPDTNQDQLSRALWINGAGASEMSVGGTGNAITIVPVTGSSGLQTITDYTQAEGIRVSFVIGITNSGAVTIQIGQTTGALLSAKKLLTHLGNDFIANELFAGQRIDCIYDSTADTGSGAWLAVSSFSKLLHIDKGYVERPIFEHVDNENFNIGAGSYYHEGTIAQRVYWDSTINFDAVAKFGSALAADTRYYIYIDNTSVVSAGTNLITIDELIITTFLPTYNAARRGHYSGSSKCIFSILTDGGGNVIRWVHDGGEFLSYDYHFTDLTSVAVGTGWTQTVNLTAPVFCTNIACLTNTTYVDGTSAGRWRSKGSAGPGHSTGSVTAVSTISWTSQRVSTNSAQQIEVHQTSANNNTMSVNTNGWFFPKGM